MTERSIIVGGQAFPCLVPVHTMLETGLHFTARTRVETRWSVNHWTASENEAERVFENLLRNKRSVHFVVDQRGEAFQFADTAARLAHAVENGGNSYGVGIEIVNMGSGPASRDFPRVRKTERIHGRPVTYGAFYEAQIQTVILLNQAICAAYGLPVVVPLGDDGDVFAEVLPPARLATFRGALGHMNLDAQKVDPAPELLRRIHAAGAGLPVA